MPNQNAPPAPPASLRQHAFLLLTLQIVCRPISLMHQLQNKSGCPQTPKAAGLSKTCTRHKHDSFPASMQCMDLPAGLAITRKNKRQYGRPLMHTWLVLGVEVKGQTGSWEEVLHVRHTENKLRRTSFAKDLVPGYVTGSKRWVDLHACNQGAPNQGPDCHTSVHPWSFSKGPSRCAGTF